VGDADLPKLFKVREEELKRYTEELQEVEGKFQELKRLVQKSREVRKLLEDEMKAIEEKMQAHREDRALFKRALYGELQYSIQEHPESLKALTILAECV